MDYRNLFINTDTFNPNNMSYVRPIRFYKESRSMGVYYYGNKESESKNKDSDSKNKSPKKQKIIVRTPKMLIPFAIKQFDNENGKKSYSMCISFSSLTNIHNEEDIKKFYYFIQKIDKTTKDCIGNYLEKWGVSKKLKYRSTLQRISDDFPCYMNLTLPTDSKNGFLFDVYDENGKKSSIDILTKRSIVSVVLELTDLRFGDKDFRSNWTVLQIRKFKPYSPIQDFFMSGCFILDEDNPEDKVYAELIEKYNKMLSIPINIPPVPYMTSYAPNQFPNQFSNQFINQPPNQPPNQTVPPPPPFIPITGKKPNDTSATGVYKPSLSELLSAKKCLKKVETPNNDENKTSTGSESKSKKIDLNSSTKSESKSKKVDLNSSTKSESKSKKVDLNSSTKSESKSESKSNRNIDNTFKSKSKLSLAAIKQLEEISEVENRFFRNKKNQKKKNRNKN